MSDLQYPKVLVITPVAFNRVTGGGLTFSALFQGWPKERVATIHNDPEPTTNDVCSEYFFITHEELNFSFPFSLLKRINQSQKDTDKVNLSVSPQKNIKTKILGYAKRVFSQVFGESIPESATLTPALKQWIEVYQPDLIYTILGSNGMMTLIEEIRRKFDLPVVTHIMDDWVSSNHGTGVLAAWERRKMTSLFGHFMNVSAKRLSITPAMSKAYEIRYRQPFEAFQNTIDTKIWQGVSRGKAEVSTPIDVLYVGSIFPNAQLNSLKILCQVVGDLSDLGHKITLTLSSPSGHAKRYRNQLEIHPAVKIEDTIRDDDVFFNRIAKADILLLPVNFDADSVRFIRYSMPTKVPAYLTVGTPILLYAPAGIAQVEYARDDEWGLIVDDPSIEGLKQAILELSSNSKLRSSMSKIAKGVARKNHDSSIVRARFHQVLTQVVVGRKGP